MGKQKNTPDVIGFINLLAGVFVVNRAVKTHLISVLENAKATDGQITKHSFCRAFVAALPPPDEAVMVRHAARREAARSLFYRSPTLTNYYYRSLKV